MTLFHVLYKRILFTERFSLCCYAPVCVCLVMFAIMTGQCAFSLVTIISSCDYNGYESSRMETHSSGGQKGRVYMPTFILIVRQRKWT